MQPVRLIDLQRGAIERNARHRPRDHAGEHQAARGQPDGEKAAAAVEVQPPQVHGDQQQRRGDHRRQRAALERRLQAQAPPHADASGR